MCILEENWKVLTSFFPTGWQQVAWQSGAVERLRGFPSPDLLLRTLMLHVARGYSLRETVVRAKLANWTDISDVALLKRLRNSEEWLRWLCVELLRENVAFLLEESTSRGVLCTANVSRCFDDNAPCPRWAVPRMACCIAWPVLDVLRADSVQHKEPVMCPTGMRDFSSREALHFGNGYISCGRKHPRTMYVVHNASDALADHFEPDS